MILQVNPWNTSHFCGGLAAVDTTVLDAYFFLVRRLRPGAEIFSILFQVSLAHGWLLGCPVGS